MPPWNNPELLDLSKKLKAEKLFVSNERRELEVMNRRVEEMSTRLIQQAWLTGQQRLALESLSRGQLTSPFSSEFLTTTTSMARSSSTSFDPQNNHQQFGLGGDGEEPPPSIDLIPGHKAIPGKYYQAYLDLLTLLRTHPDLVALLMSTYEKERTTLSRVYGGPSTHAIGAVLQAIINIYGGIGGPLPGDGALHLKLLSALGGLQLSGSEVNGRRVLRQGSCAFSNLYRLISETLPSSRLFLVGALHGPVTRLLASQELLVLGTEVTPTSPFSIEAAAALFQAPDPSSSTSTSTNQDIASLVRTDKMAGLIKLFIQSILENVHSFPPGLAWLIKSIHSQLSLTLPEREVSLICTDLIWALFICPAVTNPEPFGVTDAPVGTQARHTLSQVATILQALALSPWEGGNPRLTEYSSYFNPDELATVLQQVLRMEGLPSESMTLVPPLTRRIILLPESQLNPLFSWLRDCLLLLEHTGKLIEIPIFPTLVRLSSAVNDSLLPPGGNHLTLTAGPRTGSPAPPPPSAMSISGSNSGAGSPAHSHSGSPAHRSHQTPNTLSLLQNGGKYGRKTDGGQGQAKPPQPATVLVFPVNSSDSIEWVGLQPESEVLPQKGPSKSSKVKLGGSGGGSESLMSGDTGGERDLMMEEDDPDEDEDEGPRDLGEKRTRFSLSQDDGSLGASDNLEAVSEGASTHSVSSSIEMEDQNDNFSDMLSANVSGRGTPNVSGRNTPLSQAEEDEDEEGDPNLGNIEDEVDDAVVDGAEGMEEDDLDLAPPNGPIPLPQDQGGPGNGGVEGQPRPLHNLNPPNLNNLNLNGDRHHHRRTGPSHSPSKQARSEIEDKFCKFEIKKLVGFGGDETTSLVSDTWSTDVLASDSEFGGEGGGGGGGGRLLLPVEPGAVGGVGGGHPVVPPGSVPPGGGGGGGGGSITGSGGALGVDLIGNNETMSEAWSTDVAANDIERLHDFDTEETCSVARSDETARSEMDIVAFDTPRSSDSGLGGAASGRVPPVVPGGPLVPGERDLLMFDDVLRPESDSELTISVPIMGGGGQGQAQASGGGVDQADMDTEPFNPGLGAFGPFLPSPRSTGAISLPESGPTGELIRGLPSPHLGGGAGGPGTPGSSSSLQVNTPGSVKSVPGTSGGSGISRTITFDKTAERGDREQWDEESGRTRKFFRNFKLFRGKIRKGGRGQGPSHDHSNSGSDSLGNRHDWDREREGSADPSFPILLRHRKSFSDDLGTPGSVGSSPGLNESSDEILAKYRRKPGQPDVTDSPGVGGPSSSSEPGGGSGRGLGGPPIDFGGPKFPSNPTGGGGPPPPLLTRRESLKMSRSELIQDARRRLRWVLSNCDLHLTQVGDGSSLDTSLINMLRIEVSSAILRSDGTSAAHLQEAIRTIGALGPDGTKRVIRHLRDDYRRRSDYVSYLMRAKQGLLSTLQFLERSSATASREGLTYSSYLITEWVRLRLEEPAQEAFLSEFIRGFSRTTAVDENIELLDRFIRTRLEAFVGGQGLNEWQTSEVESALELHIVAKIYLHALYPNGEADIHRDVVLRDHISRLEAVVTPSHRALRIPKSQLSECPWPPAQRELKMLSAYKTPGDKLKCVVRVTGLIVNLLNSSSERPVSADDVVPVLVYVIIKVNPSALLSTIQYVNSFYGSKITGEDEYWWTQFCSAVEFIKTMDYTE